MDSLAAELWRSAAGRRKDVLSRTRSATRATSSGRGVRSRPARRSTRRGRCPAPCSVSRRRHSTARAADDQNERRPTGCGDSARKRRSSKMPKAPRRATFSLVPPRSASFSLVQPRSASLGRTCCRVADPPSPRDDLHAERIDVICARRFPRAPHPDDDIHTPLGVGRHVLLDAFVEPPVLRGGRQPFPRSRRRWRRQARWRMY